MKAFVINLEQRPERRRAMAQQLTKLGIEFEIVSGVNGAAMSEAQLNAACDQDEALRCVRRRLTAGEIGCALSHLEVFRRIVAQGLPMALVLEDDALLGPNTPGVLEALERLPVSGQPRVFLLSHVLKYSAWRRQALQADGASLYPAMDAFCAHGYVATNAAARRLSSYFRNLHHPFDYWNTLRRRRVVSISGLVPYCIGHSALAKESDIDPERRRTSGEIHVSGAERMKDLAYRLLYEKFIYQMAKPMLRIRRQEKGALEKLMRLGDSA